MAREPWRGSALPGPHGRRRDPGRHWSLECGFGSTGRQMPCGQGLSPAVPACDVPSPAHAWPARMTGGRRDPSAFPSPLGAPGEGVTVTTIGCRVPSPRETRWEHPLWGNFQVMLCSRDLPGMGRLLRGQRAPHPSSTRAETSESTQGPGTPRRCPHCRHPSCMGAPALTTAVLRLRANEENKPQPKEGVILALNKRNVFILQ